MKKPIVFTMVLSLLLVPLLVQPASARSSGFWPGVVVGVGSAILMGHIFHPPRVYYYETRPAYVYPPPAAYCPPPAPIHRERWIPGHWVERTDPYGNFERYWVPGHWERVY